VAGFFDAREPSAITPAAAGAAAGFAGALA
jgi:hypothetical protein